MQKAINNAIGGLKADVTVATNGMNGIFSDETLGGTQVAQVVNFNQTINSPKSIDRLSIYRDTNSLLFNAKVGLSNV